MCIYIYRIIIYIYTCDITQRYFTLHLYKMAMIFPKDTDGDGKLTLSERLGVAAQCQLVVALDFHGMVIPHCF